MKIAIGITTYKRDLSLAIVMGNLLGQVSYGTKIYIAHGESLNNPLLKQVLGSFEQSKLKVEYIHNPEINLERGREKLYKKSKSDGFDWLIYMDDDFIIDNGNFKKLISFLKNVKNKYSLVQVAQPVGYPIYKDNHILIYQAMKERQLIPIEFAGGMFALNLKEDIEFDFELNRDEPGEDREIGKRIKGEKVLVTDIWAYHMSSKEIGTNFNYKKYFGEENRNWE